VDGLDSVPVACKGDGRPGETWNAFATVRTLITGGFRSGARRAMRLRRRPAQRDPQRAAKLRFDVSFVPQI
jgi:hypothetical protein